MKIGIIGTRGIPNHYGGFEQFAEYLSVGLVNRGHDVWVYNSSSHPFQDSLWNNVNIAHCYDPENKIGTTGQFIYDFNCIRDARTRGFDVILQLGYTSSSVWGPWLPEEALVFTNMDGLEWKRSKYSTLVKRFLKRAESWAVKTSNFLIADSLGIQSYLKDTYSKPSTYIPYGAELFSSPDEQLIHDKDLEPYGYYLLIARMEPENNIETILDGYVDSGDQRPFLVVGNAGNKFGLKLQQKYRDVSRICFCGGIYDMVVLNNLRWFARLYFHGHSVGGTNPSLLEAMAANALIVAHDNVFNRAILDREALYFKSSADVAALVSDEEAMVNRTGWVERNRTKIAETYSWDQVVDQYLKLFENELNRGRS